MEKIVDIGVPGEVEKLLGNEVTTLREIIENNQIKLPSINYNFIMDIMIVCEPSVLKKCVEIMRKDSKNYHSSLRWLNKKENNFFNYLYRKEGWILCRMIRELSSIDIETVKKHCVQTYMQCDGKQINMTTNIKIANKILAA